MYIRARKSSPANFYAPRLYAPARKHNRILKHKTQKAMRKFSIILILACILGMWSLDTAATANDQSTQIANNCTRYDKAFFDIRNVDNICTCEINGQIYYYIVYTDLDCEFDSERILIDKDTYNALVVDFCSLKLGGYVCVQGEFSYISSVKGMPIYCIK